MNVFNSYYSGGAVVETSQQIRNDVKVDGDFSFGSWVSWGGQSGTLFSLQGEDGGTVGPTFTLNIDDHGSLVFENDYSQSMRLMDAIADNEISYSITGFGQSGHLITPNELTHIGIVFTSDSDSPETPAKLWYFKNGVPMISGSAPSSFTGRGFENDLNMSQLYFSVASKRDGSNSMSVAMEETWLSPYATSYANTGSFSGIIDISKTKSSPDELVYIGDTQVTGDRVVHFARDRKYISVPSGEGTQSVYAGSNKYSFGEYTGLNGWKLYGDELYRYLNTYNYKVEDSNFNKFVGGTKSPFRILQSVPENAINLAYITQQDFSVENSISYVDLSYKTLQNISNYSYGEFSISLSESGTAGTTTGNKWTYSGQVDTNDIAVSSNFIAWNSDDIGSRAYYHHLVGQGRYGVKSKDNTAENLRLNLTLIDSNKKAINKEEFPWDIVYTSGGPTGQALPTGVFGVSVVTTYPYLKDRTVWVQYPGFDFLSSGIEYGRQEILNPEPIYVESEDYTLSFNENVWDITIDNITITGSSG